MTKDRPKPPTAEEEQAKLDKTLADAEKLKSKKDNIDDIPDLKLDESGKPIKEEEKEIDKDEDEDDPDKDKKIVTPKDLDYKEKFIQSTKEAQILSAKLKKLSEAKKKSKAIPEPTEDELKKEYSDWEDLSPDEQRRAKDALMISRRFNALDNVTQEFEDIDSWNDTVDEFMADPANIINNPLLEGKESEFKAFASRPTRRGVDFEDLIKAFLYDITLDEEGKTIKKKKGKMFPTGSGGDKNQKPKSNKISMDDARRLRESNYGKWKQYLNAGMIEDEF